ncbi:MAG: calcium-binding protein [Deltaproteobacteria bacterium]
MKRSRTLVGWRMAALGIASMACGSPASDAENPAAPPAQGGSAGNSNGTVTGSSGSSSSSNNGGSGSGDVPLDPTDTLPGVDPPLDIPPAGCVRGARNGALLLELDPAVPSVELRAQAGILFANRTSCSDAAGAELPLTDLLSLQIMGGSEDDAVVIDLGSGDWSPLLDSAESLQVGLGTGENGLVLRGSAGSDHYRHAMRGKDLVLDLVGNGTIHAVASGVTELGFSLGDGDDRLEDLGTVRAAAEPAWVPAPGQAPLTGLSLPLVVSGGAGDDWLVGGTKDDEFDGGVGDDVASGLAGNDRFLSDIEGDGRDIWNGGPGYDQISYELRSTDLDLEVCSSPALLGCEGECVCDSPSGSVGEGDEIVNIEELRGGSGNDLLRGSDVSESLRGGPGNDSLFGLGGSDLLAGEGGVDQLEGGTDGDICDGQPDETVSGCEL